MTLLTFPLAQVARLQLGYDINVTLFDCSVILTGLSWLIYAARNPGYKKTYLAKPLILFLLIIILSLVANFFTYSLDQILVAALYGLRWFLYACMYFVVVGSTESFKKRLPDLLTISGGAVLLFGYLQYFLYSNLRNLYYLGWDEHMARMFSSFLDPNFFGAFLVLYFIFVISRICVDHKKLLSARNVLFSLLAFFSFAGIFLTTSRSAIIMLGVSLCVYLILIKQKKLIVAFIAVVIIIFIAASRFFYLENINPFRIASSLARVESGQNAVRIIENNSLIGIGFNAYRYAQIQYGFREPVPEFPSHADSGTDTSLLFVFATTGIVGLLTYLFLLVKVYRLGRSKDSVTGKVLVAVIIGLVVNSIFINSLFYPLILYWLWTLAGLTDYT